MKKFKIQRAAVILFGCICGFLQIFYYPILEVCFPQFLKDYKGVADGISIAITICLAASIYVFVTMILRANHYLWTLRQQAADCAYVKLPALTEEASVEHLVEGVLQRSKAEGWGQLEDVEFCGASFTYLLVKTTSCVYLKKAEHLEEEAVLSAQKAILANVDATGYRKRQEAVVCFCCETASSEAKAAAKTCVRRGKTAVYTVVLEASTGRAYCLLTNRRGKIQDNICQKTLAKLALGFLSGTVPDSAKSGERNPVAADVEQKLSQFRLIAFWKASR